MVTINICCNVAPSFKKLTQTNFCSISVSISNVDGSSSNGGGITVAAGFVAIIRRSKRLRLLDQLRINENVLQNLQTKGIGRILPIIRKADNRLIFLFIHKHLSCMVGKVQK